MGYLIWGLFAVYHEPFLSDTPGGSKVVWRVFTGRVWQRQVAVRDGEEI